jgi:PKD repeat protein
MSSKTKFKIYHLSYIFLFSLLFACERNDPVAPIPSSQAKFKAEILNSGIAPARVIFTNESVNAKSFLWKFGTGDSLYTTDTDTFSYKYNDAGIYEVSLSIEPENPSLFYNTLTYNKTIVISPVPVKRLYFTDRVEGKVKYVILDDNPNPVIEEFESSTLNKPYGMHLDTSTGKVYVTDYAEQVLNRYFWNGTDAEVLMNTGSPNFDSPIGIIVIENKIYWCEPDGINFANLDGSNPKVFLSMPGEYPQDLVFDHINNQIYFTNNMNTESGGIWKVNIDATGLTEIIPSVWGAAIEIDPENNRLYFYVGDEGMYISDLEGNNVALFDSSNADKWCWGMAIDKEGGKIYYPNRSNMSIMRANLDGTNIETFIPTIADINPNAMTIDTYR